MTPVHCVCLTATFHSHMCVFVHNANLESCRFWGFISSTTDEVCS
jgi:hypothetical protein